jgi:pyruvate formate lyase activating enzyme
MIIGGLIKQSLIDYPGKIAAVVFTQGCNFRCGYCHNPQLVLPDHFSPQTISEEEVFSFLHSQIGWLDAVVVSGGEPTIHNDLPYFLRKIKALGYLVKLDTNGSNPVMLNNILNERLVDYVAMDIKTNMDQKSYNQIIGTEYIQIEKIKVSAELLKNAPLKVEFRTTVLPEIHSPQIIEKIKNFIGEDFKLTINNFRAENTLYELQKELMN